MNEIFARDLNGEIVSPSDQGYDELINSIWDTMKTAAELNNGYHTPDEVRRILGEIIGQEVDESVTLLPPFYVDYGKHIKIGKGCFIQQCCTFFGRGGITLGEHVLVGPKVNIITINHDSDPENRSATYGRPVVIEDKVWIGINATILPGVRVGYGAIIGANSVVTKDVPPMTVVAGNPARIIKELKKRNIMKEENNKMNISRRGFLKTAALAGAALTMPTGLNKVFAAETKQTATSDNNSNVAHITGHRILGKGKAAFEVSALGFGVMGMTYNRSQHPDKKQCIRLLHEAVDRGVTLFDTAIIYGPLTNENLAREALAEFKGRINVTTKFGHEVIDGKGTGRQDSRPETIRRYCEESLRRLRLDSLPMFYQHRADPNTPAEEVASTIADLMKEGKVQHWGMCEVNAETIHKAHAVCPLTAIQSEYHLMHRLVEENGVLDACRELGIGFVPYSPLNRGFLGGCINEYTVFDPNNDNRQTLPRFQAEAMRANTRIVNVLQAFGRTRGMTSTQVALGWLLQKAPWIVPIPGTTKLAHLEENLRTLEFTLSPEEWKELENAVATIPVVGDRYNAEQQRQVGR